ncbi:hypothetical protein PSTEL_04315 [Paenibacillus stellifer]|uniref:Uncharacterized protein n=1 Tax=Paenibacillus stellifer TaxID=169760 RepID=A0A089LTC4_9BACL|nr:TerB family tellurite resistance protein [Paenibacillus stellifer]AIQ62448.1 hypothetical protein PSTEL_04315 [Paenibacillus stellifer]
MEYQERVSYLEALMFMATIDEKVEENELEHFNRVAAMYGISSDEIESIKEIVLKKEKTVEEILSPIKSRQTKLALIYELLALCYTDGSYNFAEKNGMTNVCNILNIEISKLRDLENIIEESIQLQKKINTILEREE